MERLKVSLKYFSNLKIFLAFVLLILSPLELIFGMTTLADLRLGPLTTTFTYSPDCNSITVSAAGDSSYAPYVYPRLFSSIATSCFPSGFPLGNAALISTFGVYNYHDEHVYYSPGLCPSGWLNNTVGTSNAETTAFCCQPGFNPGTTPAVLGGASSTFCTSKIDSTVITTVAYTGDGEADGFSSTFTFRGNVIPAPAIWIRYKDGDFDLSATTTSTSSAALSSSTSRTQNSSSTSSPSSTPVSASVSSSGLSTGAKIGLGLGTPLAVILVVAIFAFIFIRRRKQRRFGDVAGNEEESSRSEVKNQAELLGGRVRPTSELPAGEVGVKTFVGASKLNAGGAMGLPVSELEGGEAREVHGRQIHELSGVVGGAR